MQYDEYGNDQDFDEQDLGGLTIQDGLGGEEELSAEELIAHAMMGGNTDLGHDEGEGEVNQSFSGVGGATAESFQLNRFSHLEYRLQAGLKAVLSSERIDGIHPVDAAAAREEFASVIGHSNLEAFAKQIKVDESVQVPNEERELNQVISMLQNSSGTYMARGAGGALAGHNVFGEETEWQKENQGRADEDLLKAVQYVQEIADVYLDDRTRGSSVEDARRQALEESITKRMIDGTFYEGSGNLLPLPNETGVTGIKSTQGIFGSFQGTAEDRLSASQFDDLYQQIPTETGKTRFVRNEEGHKVFREDVTKEQRNDALRRTPSLANSLFPKPKAVGKQTFTGQEKAKHTRDQKFLMSQLQTKANVARKILRQETITTRDESKGNQLRMAGWDTPYGEQADLQSLRNEASVQGEEWNSFYAGQKDDDSKQSSMNDLVQEMLSEDRDDSLDELDEETGEWVDPTKPLLGASQDSPKQGTKEWLAQRKGHITASTAAGLLKEGGIEERATELAMERLGTAEPFTGNAHTREGTEGEDKAAAAFMASKHAKGLTMKEAFFETNENIPNFGVSPDGRLYDDEGESAGLLELKYLSSGSMEGAVKKYTPQVQMQMAVTGESQTHFYALDKYTGEYVHELIQADPVMQKQLITAGTQALELGASLDNRGIQALRKEIKSKKKPRQQSGAKEEVVGQQEAIKLVEEFDEPMTAFQADALAMAQTPASGGIASQTLLAKKMQQQEQSEKMKQAVDNAKELPTDTLEFEQTKAKKEQAQARNSFVDGNARPAFGEQTDLAMTEMADYYKAEEKAAKAATREEANVRRMAAAETAAYAEDAKRSAPAIEAAKQEANITNIRNQAGARNTFIENNQRPAFGDTDGGINKDMANFYKQEENRVNEATKTATAEEAATRKLALTEISAYAEDEKRTKDIEEAAAKETANAAKEASNNLREFGNEVKKASAVLGEIANVVMGGNKSGMDEVRLAAESGIEVEQVRGMRKAMELGGLSEGGINKVIGTAGDLVTTFNDERTSASKFTELMSTRGASNLESVNQLEMPTYQEFQDMDAQQMTVMVAGMMQGKSMEAKTQIGKMFGMTDLAVSNISPEMIEGLDNRIDEEGLRDTNVGIQKVLQEKRALLETSGSLGETSGKAIAATSIGAAVVGSATAGYAASKFAKTSTATKLMESAKASKSSVAAKITSNASKVLKSGGKVLGGVGAIYAIGDWAVDQANEIDAAFFGGERNEHNQEKHKAQEDMLEGNWKAGTWWADDSSIDDAVPSTDIGKMPMKGREDKQGGNTNVNVEVTNEISPDLIRTTTNVDGDLNVDEESNLGTGG